MKRVGTLALSLLGVLVSAYVAHAQGFSSGSNGSFGPVNVTSGGTLTIDLPPDGVIHATTVTVGGSAMLNFNRNALNTPVFLLATGNIDIQGLIDVSAKAVSPPTGGAGGPGGFDGGTPGLFGSPPGDGHGPGAGRGGDRLVLLGDVASVGSAGYGGAASDPTPLDGQTYGSPLLVPLVGGSGGGGSSAGDQGGGGGGAILLASSTRVNMSGTIFGRGGTDAFTNRGGSGSGGAIRLVAPLVAGSGALDVFGGFGIETGGHGRVRIDVIDRSQLTLSVQPPAALTVGSFMVVFPPVVPRLDILNVAGRPIAEGTPGPVQVLLPFGAPTSQPVTVQARDFAGTVPIDIVLTPANGPRTVVQTTIDMSTGNPAQRTLNVNIPVNVVTQINAWTR